MKLCETFDTNALHLASRTAVMESGRTWSYAQLLLRSESLSDHLSSIGIGNGHRVAIMMPNSGAFVMSFFSVLRTGAVVVPLNERYQDQELLFYLGDAGPSVFLVSPDLTPVARRALSRIPEPPLLIEVASEGSFTSVTDGEIGSSRAIDGDDTPALLQFTSGSTGTPKRVVRTDKQLIVELDTLSKVLDLKEEDRFLGAAPFSHVNGLIRTMMASMLKGGTLYTVESFNRRQVLKILSDERITYFGGVPYMYIALTVTPLRQKVDLSSLRVAFSSSAPLLPDDNRAFEGKYGMFIRQLYGCTEMGTISVNNDAPVGDALGSVGLPLEGIRVEIFDNEKKIVADGQLGEVGIKSSSGITAYENNPEANEQSFKDGYYLSGDLGFKDPEGRLILTGRKKFLINRGGYEVNPYECEQAIMAHPKVDEAVVIGVPTKHGDNALKSLVVVNATCSEREIVEHCRSLIADYKVPGTIEFVKTLPKTQTGKILRDKCS